MRIGALLLLLLVLTGCARTVTDSGTPGVPADPGRHEVPWEDYDPSVQVRIDDMEVARDCVGLQGEFDTADRNNAATIERTGHGNADLMRYIDEALRNAGCY